LDVRPDSKVVHPDTSAEINFAATKPSSPIHERQFAASTHTRTMAVAKKNRISSNVVAVVEKSAASSPSEPYPAEETKTASADSSPAAPSASAPLPESVLSAIESGTAFVSRLAPSTVRVSRAGSDKIAAVDGNEDVGRTVPVSSVPPTSDVGYWKHVTGVDGKSNFSSNNNSNTVDVLKRSDKHEKRHVLFSYP
jgi:hypothetical protein